MRVAPEACPRTLSPKQADPFNRQWPQTYNTLQPHAARVTLAILETRVTPSRPGIGAGISHIDKVGKSEITNRSTAGRR